ncbi:MAG: RNA-binding protein [Candidatus Nitrosocosmicus sp.]
MDYNVGFENVQNSLNSLSSQMKQLEQRREALIKETREVISLCSKAIILLHGDKVKDSEALLNTASSSIKKLKDYVICDLDRYLWPAEQEYVEAYVLKEIVERKSFLSGHDELNVSLNAYVTGLLDCTGEIKRMIYDNLRKNNHGYSLSLFEIMQSIYNLVYPFSIYDNLIPGIRKKLDVSKRMMEDVRITMTEEYQRTMFLNEFKSVSERKQQ